MGLFGSKSGTIGLDIGADSVKATELSMGKDSFRLTTYGMIGLPQGTIQQSEIANPSELVTALKELKKKTKMNTNNAVVGISGPNVIVKNIVMTYMSPEELENQIYWEAEQFIPMNIDEVNLDYAVLGQPKPEDAQMDVVLVAAKKDFVNSYVDVVTQAGLNPVVVDIAAFALENMYAVNYPTYPDQTVILADIGAQQIKLIVLDGGLNVFSRDINLGGAVFTEEIRNQLGVSFEEAENLKMGGGSQEIPVEVQDILTSVSQTFASEIQRSLDFYLASSSNNPIKSIYLSGGGSLTPGLPQVISERTSFPVELVNPFARIEYSEKQFSAESIHTLGPIAATSVGLALRSKDD
jgi:type IV pilus assembly protein PilM